MSGQIVTFSGASGVGKTTIVGKLLNIVPNLKLISSHTDRKRRESDLPGEYIYYTSGCEFERVRNNNSILWGAELRDKRYFTTKDSVLDTKHYPGEIFGMLLTPIVIDTLKSFASDEDIKVTSIYILSPSEAVLRRRLYERANKELRAKLITDLSYVLREAHIIETQKLEHVMNIVGIHYDRQEEAYQQIQMGISGCKEWDQIACQNMHLYNYFIENEGPLEETVQKVVDIINKL